ncbi:MAG: hypothetical protein H6747_04460 [Deltaproteobacteria bacterium]|nr:hypothetical protein [Deltaproteobacteria bacterium]
MTSQRVWVLAATILAMACSETTVPAASDTAATASDAAGTDATTSDGGGGAADSSASDASGSSKWWTCPAVTGEPPQRAAGCEAPDDGVYGCKRKFTGWTQDGSKMTCNRCLGGDPKVQGSWRAIAFDSEDPEKPLANGLRELLVIDGNTWHLHTEVEEKGQKVEVRVDGWYFCADAVELKSERLVFVVTSVAPNQTLGWFSPDVFTGEFLTKDGNLLAWGMNATFEKDWIGYANYCRVGDTVGGKPCLDPFLGP